MSESFDAALSALDDEPVPEYSDVMAALAEGASLPPPHALRAEAIAEAVGRRRPLVALHPVEDISSLDAFSRTAEDMHRLLVTLTPDEWLAPTTTPYGRVRDLVAHLSGIEAVALRWVGAGVAADPSVAEDHVAVTAPIVAALASVPAAKVLDRWWSAANDLIAACASADMDAAVMAHDIPTDVDGMLVLRTFEIWSHIDDIRVAVGRGRAPLDGARAWLMSRRLMVVLPLAVALDGQPVEGSVRMVLTGDGGGTYDLSLGGPGGASAGVVANVVDVCRMAARRLDASLLDVEIEGDEGIAQRVLSSVGAFARD